MLSKSLKNSLKKYKIPLILLFLVFISLIIEFTYGSYFITAFHGNWYSMDQDVVITSAYRLSKNNFYLNDFLTSKMADLYPSQIFYLVSVVYNLANDMFLTIFLFSLFLKILFVFSTFLLSKYLLKNEKLALLATFMLSFSHFMGAEEIGVTQLMGKSFVFAFMPLLFYLFFKYYKKLSIPVFIVLGILLNFHSVTVFPVMFLFLFSLLFHKKNYKLFFCCLAICSLFSLLYFNASNLRYEQFDISIHSNPGGFLPPDVYKTILKFAFVIVSGFFIVRRKNKELFKWFLILLLYSALTTFSLFGDKMLLMQFYRSFKYVIYFCFIYSTLIISWLWKKSKLFSLVFFLLLFIPFSTFYYSTALEGITKSKSLYLTQTSNLMALGGWLDKNTPKDSTLLIPPDWFEIKIWSRRAVVNTQYDVNWCAYSKRISVECKERANDTTWVYSQTSTSEFSRTANKYGAQYVVTYNKTLDLVEVFNIGDFKVYSVLS